MKEEPPPPPKDKISLLGQGGGRRGGWDLTSLIEEVFFCLEAQGVRDMLEHGEGRGKRKLEEALDHLGYLPQLLVGVKNRLQVCGLSAQALGTSWVMNQSFVLEVS